MRENIKKDFGLGGGGVQGFRAQLTFHFSLWVDDHSSVVCTNQMGGGEHNQNGARSSSENGNINLPQKGSRIFINKTKVVA